LEPEPLTRNEPKPKRKAKRELEPVQPVEPDTEPALEPEPLRTAEPIQKPEPKPVPVPIPAPKPQAIPASDAQQLAELEQNNLSFILSPTPAKSYLLINCYEEIKSEVTLDIQDLNGKVVLSEKVSKKNGNFEVKMDISSLPDGVYFIKIYVENTDYVQRFVKEK
jgi:outer membrane biosynthesis protein TonB